jgi:hypothetical protein
MLNDLLNTARNKFAAHQREKEIRHLDIDPEEYVMLRDDKTPMAEELLSSILEKLNIPNWMVDEKTLRIVRISEAPGARRNWSLALTSDTRRFHLKVYRDFGGDLDEIDLASNRGLCSAICFVEQTIHDIRQRELQAAEMRKLAAIEEGRRRQKEELANIIAKVEQINNKYQNLYSKWLSAAQLGEELLASAEDYITRKAASMPQTQIVLSIDDDIISVRQQFEGKQFSIIDNVPCEFDIASSEIHASNRFIKNCIEGRNFIYPICPLIQYEPETRSLILSTVGKPDRDLSAYEHLQGFTNGRLGNLTNPLAEAERILSWVTDLDENVSGDVAKISVLSIYSEVSTFKELMQSIDSLLTKIADNVDLIIWNDKNSN